MTPVRSTPRWLSRLGSLLLVLALLTVFVVPAMAQEGVAPEKPSGAACAPLSHEEQATFDKLAQVKKAGELTGSDYELFVKLGEQAGCANTPVAPDAISAVSGYVFSQSSGTYTEIAGGTVLGTTGNDDNNFTALPIGFTLNYNGTDYTTFSVNANGFIAMGSSIISSYVPISGGTTNNVISALGRDNESRTDGELSYLTQGSGPNRTLTVQWKKYQNYTSGLLDNGNIFNFQIILYETSNVVEVRYGAFTVTTTPSSNPQVGLRGGSSSDYSNRTGSNWAASTAGAINSATMTLSTSAFPASGQIYTWTPPSGPPSCATSPSPATAATNVAIPTSLGWSAGVGGGLPPTSYDVYFGTSGTPPFVVNVAASPYNPGALVYSTLYYWQIVPKNASGPATGCPVWSFTTQADPTITPPWLEPFVTYPPTNWTEATGLLAAPTTLSGTSSAWLADAFGNVGATNNSARVNIYGTLVKDWMFTPPVNLGSGMGYQLEFDLALTPFGGTGSATLGSDDKFAVVISTDGGTTWTSANTLQQWNSGTPISNTGNHIVINLSSYSGIVKFGFYGESTVSNADNDLFVDNVQVRQPPAGPPNCAINPAPADAATNVSITTNLAWSAGVGGGTPTSYDVYFGLSGTPPFVANVAASPYNPGTLAYSTPYYWQIVPKNASGSATGCPIWSFTTEADPTITTFPYAQSFGTATCTIPAGWTNDPSNLENWLFDVPGNNADPAQYGADADHTTGTGCIAWINDSSPDNANPAQLLSPPLNISALSAPALSFWYQNVDGGSVGAVSVLKVDVFDGTSWQEDLLTVNTALDNWTEFTLDLTPYKSTSTRIRFQANEQIGDFDSDPSLDDVSVFDNTTPPNCATSFSPAVLATNVLATANLTWAGGGGGPTGYKISFGTNNPPTNITNSADLGNVTTYDPPGNMAYSTTHYWQIVPYNTNGGATGCPVLSFTTEADPTISAFPYSQDFNGVTAPALPSGWSRENTNADAYAWESNATYRRGTSGNGVVVPYNTAAAMNDWLFTPPLQLAGGTTYGVRFFYRGASTSFTEKIEVKWGSIASSAGMTDGPVYDDAAINFITMKEAIATFIPATSGVYYVGFHGYSALDQFNLILDDVTVYNTADSTWQWQGGTSNDWFVNSNWEGAIVPGEMDLVKIPAVAEAPNASSPLIGTSVETSYGKVNNLTVDAGATLELATNHNLKVQGVLTNNGTLKQIRAVSLGSPTVFLNITDGASPTPVNKYFGVEINPTSINMGSTTVTVGGNQQCGGVVNTTIKRCYGVQPATPAAADIKFYFSEAEMTPTGQTLANQNLWNFHTGAWNAVTRGTDSGTCDPGAINCFVQGTGISTYSPFVAGPSVPLAVTLASFSAHGDGNQILVTWETVSELNNAGFNLYRSSSADGADRALLAFVPSQSPGSTAGASYSVTDAAVTAGQTYWYVLEDVDLNGATTLHGPVSATVNAPTAVTLSSLEAGTSSLPMPVAGLALAAVTLAMLGGLTWRRRLNVS